eukprot:CAMPEP_0114436028 /NCGR_PEP_ID=MMETSP0103-20121206/13198_1 /TAXON_ID=37642 ORGANISM="Paraphysomonas imperforata, Strain PA2" /NCGR_SAMPLE_ID=MMETSP0103 /ASSEMBLY_ACC=CAM_ASM_000201 /LENGTH=643 /DNA_ID=CAMNT_0001606199 /DNA_START=165 /DNA_END=2092 /DNA_ORIENTATION=+
MAHKKKSTPPLSPNVQTTIKTPVVFTNSHDRAIDTAPMSVTTKTPQSQLREEVIFNVTGEEVVNYDDSQYLAYIQKSKTTFQNHLGHSLMKQADLSLDDYMLKLSKQPQCATKPIFMSMARVSSDLYWHLIENFFYTMYYFDNLACTVMVCVSDPRCLQLCHENDFPCYNFEYENKQAHTFEQVAAVKIRHVGYALGKGVNVMLLDLDVGFLRNPMVLYEGFLENPDIQVICQMDIGWAMDKRQGMTWMTFPRSNFGLFIVKAHPSSVRIFARGWKKYMAMPEKNKKIVAKDQSIIHECMQVERRAYGYNFSYFFPGFLPSTMNAPIIYKSALLLHKVEDYNAHGVRFELGGDVALEEVGTSIAAHATCYEKTSKLYALKAVNAFWNSAGYYMPSKKTLIKPLMVVESRAQLLDEMRALCYIAMKTKRSLIIPNILIGVGLDRPGGKRGPLLPFDYRLNALDKMRYKSRPQFYKDLSKMPMDAAPKLGENLYWPSFRSISHTLTQVEILEPGFYAKIENNLYLDVPDPFVLTWEKQKKSKLDELAALVNAIQSPRLVLDIREPGSVKADNGRATGRPRNLAHWAQDSASSWGPATINTAGYVTMPSFEKLKATVSKHSPDAQWIKEIDMNVNLCEHFLIGPKG